jgi:CubicO group peptidase (beta-lactamase class C family)
MPRTPPFLLILTAFTIMLIARDKRLRVHRVLRGHLLIAALLAFTAEARGQYYPTKDAWQTRSAEQSGFDPAKLTAAIVFAQSRQSSTKTDSAGIAAQFSREPQNDIIGPVKPRGANSGLIIRKGYIVAEWGDTRRADMTFSATKSYLSTVAALAFDDGLLRSTSDTVARDVAIPEFLDDRHNARITWQHLLQQTSEWQGTLWSKPDWVDRYNPQQGKRPVKEPGTAWTYNDVRVNALALALLNVWRRPLPQVLKERVMDPIGASSSWRWYGYNNSWVVMDGLNVQSVSGGGHWGGGLQISARDHARFGYLFLRNGRWNGKQLISEKWIQSATSPSNVKRDYGYLWWLNTDRSTHKTAPGSAFWAAGNGGNYVFIDRENDLLIVLQWTRDYQQVIEQVYGALIK